MDTGLSQNSMRTEEEESRMRFHVNASCSRVVSDLIESGRPLYLLVFIAFSSINRQPLDRKML